MLNVFDWILSPEIQEHIRKNYVLSLEEKALIICGGYRNIEEKEAALRALLEEAEPGEVREQIGQLARLYGLAIEELQKTGPEHLFVLPFSRPWSDEKDSLITCDAQLYSSYAELLEHAEDNCTGPHLGACKWERINGKWESVIEFDVQTINGAHCATQFWLSDEKEGEWGIDEDTWDFQLCHDRIPYPIPFMTGDLVKLDAPMLDAPLYGVMNNVLDLNGIRYMWLGYVDGDHLDVLPLSYNLLHWNGGYRVIDWLHSARPEELSDDEKILKEISVHLSRQPRQDCVNSDVDNEFLEIFGGPGVRIFRHWTELPFPELLAQVREAQKGHG